MSVVVQEYRIVDFGEGGDKEVDRREPVLSARRERSLSAKGGIGYALVELQIRQASQVE
jgi:hypothetical protein